MSDDLYMVFPHKKSYYPEFEWNDLYITRDALFSGILKGIYDRYTLIRKFNAKPTLYFNETNDNIISFMTTKMKQQKWNYLDHHNCCVEDFSLKEMVQLYRMMIINDYTRLYFDNNDDDDDFSLIKENPMLSTILPYHSQRYKYLDLCFKLNSCIKKLEYKQINHILNNKIFVNDLNSMKYVFRSLSSCYSFCDLCKTESKNPIQLLLTLHIQHQDKCNKIIQTLKLFTQCLTSIHLQKFKLLHINENVKDCNCRCWHCCKKRCCFESYITSERKDFAQQKYEIYHIENEIENDYDYLNLCIIPHHSTNQKYDIQIIKYLLQNDLVSLLPHHFVFAVQYHRKNILKYLFDFMAKKKEISFYQKIYQQLWLPKQFAYFGLPRPIWLQHPTRISILGFALQAHLLDLNIIKILLYNQVSPNFDDLMIITSVAGDKRLIAKHKIIKYLLNYKYNNDKNIHFLFKYGVYWFEVCLAIHCYKTAAMISSQLIPIIMQTLLDEKIHMLIPKDLLNLVLMYTFYPINPDDGWLDIDGNEILNKGTNLAFLNLMGYYGGGSVQCVEKAKQYVPPRSCWLDEKEYEQSNGKCLEIDWSEPQYPKLIRLPLAFNIGGKASIQSYIHQVSNNECCIL